MLRVKKHKFAKMIFVTLFIYSSLSMYFSDFFKKVFDMEEFVWAEVIKLIFPYSIITTIAFFMIVLWVNSSIDGLSNEMWQKLFAFIFSFIFLAGFNITAVGKFAENMHSMRMVLFDIVFLIGMYYVTRFTMMHVIKAIGLVGKSELNSGRLPEKKQFFLVAAILVICWMPYVILRYPAGFECDAYHQIADFIEGTMTNHWPVASSVTMGIFVLAGQSLLGSANIGIFVYCIVQTIIGAFIFSYAALVMRRLKMPALFVYMSVIVFALVPNYPGYITSVVKDAPFSCAVLLFVLLVVQQVLEECFDKGFFIAVTGFIVCILRNNGVFIVGGLLIALLIASLFKKRLLDKKLIVSLFVCALIYALYTSTILPALGIRGTSEAEALSVPFQQTARLATWRRSEISDKDAEIINDVLSLDIISTEYDPELSDVVKGTYHSDDIVKLLKYFGVWLKEGLQNPDVYLDAFLHNSIGFMYPDIRMGNSPVVSGMYGQVWNDREVQFIVPDKLYQVRDDIKENISAYENLPVIFPFVNVAIQLWIPIGILFWAIQRKNMKLIFLLIPSVVGVLVCLASPTYMNNGSRYALPVIYTNMLMIGIAIMMSAENKLDNDSI